MALDLLGSDPGFLTIDELSAGLNVSKGSFYWHFKNRSDFIAALVAYWNDTCAQETFDKAGGYEGSAEDRLYSLMETLRECQVSKYEVAVRAYACNEPAALSMIHELDRARLAVVKGVFEDMGLAQPEAVVRARVFLIYEMFDLLGEYPLGQPEEQELLARRHSIFTRL
jgi:AcrR family transcriptional regulator